MNAGSPIVESAASTSYSDKIQPWVAAAVAGDRSSLDQLLRASQELLVRIAIPLVPQWAIDDVVQETLLIVVEKLHHLSRPETYRAWLSRIALHVCYGWHRKRQLSQSREAMVATPVEDPSIAELRAALAALGSKDRDILVLREYIGLTYEELAEVFRVPLGTIRSRLSTARQNLKAELQKSGIG